MPNIVVGNPDTRTSPEIANANFDYSYPRDLKLKPGSELHDYIKNQILERARASNTVMSERFPSWREIDRTLTAYIPATEAEKDLKEEDERKPTAIVFPYSYAMMETLLTYMVMAFLQDPVFRYEGVGPEDTIGAIMLEHVIQQQVLKAKMGLELHTFFRDGLSYGLGVTAPRWEVKKGRRRRKSSFMSRLTKGKYRSKLEDYTVYAGNNLESVDPYQFLPDPNVPIHKAQDGEFVGWVASDNYMNLLTDERDGDEYFNVKYLQLLKHRRSQFAQVDESDRQTRFGGRNENETMTTSELDKIYMYINLIPKDWKLGSGMYPEKWLFCLAADEVLIQAQPMNLDHEMYPVSVIAPEFDGHSSTSISRLEILYGLQHTLDFLFNSHTENVRKAVNDMLVVDPYMVNIKDVEDPKPGKIIRLRRPAWGRGVKDAVMQLNVTDITRGNIADSDWIVHWMQKIASADDSLMGSMRSGGPERLTGAEFQGTRGGAVSRLERMGKVIGMQGMQDLATMFASHTLQLMDEDTYIKVSGDWQRRLEAEYGISAGDGKMNVTPFDLMVNYDVNMRDGSVPGANSSPVWMQMFDRIAQTPELQGEFDLFRIFSKIARDAGEKNVEEYRKRQSGPTSVQVGSDEQVLDQVQRGNLVPMGGA